MKKILVVDDDDNLRADLLEVLGFEGYEAFGAENGQKGLGLSREQLPDLIICDITMPSMDGFEVIAALQQDPQTVNIPIIVLSARNDETFVKKGLQLGAVAYVFKPYVLTNLLNTIRNQIGC